MNASNCFSSNEYLFLPTKKDPKVALVIDNAALSNNSFKLYNPFSKKARLLKKMTKKAFTDYNMLSKKLFSTETKKKFNFIKFMEERLGEQLVVSVYFATARDKLVLQLQTPDAKIIGYIKFPLSETGLKRLNNEKKALDILSSKRIVEKYLLWEKYENIPFLLLSETNGNIGHPNSKAIDDLLLRFRRKESYSLANHPRIQYMIDKAKQLNVSKLEKTIEKIRRESATKYFLVYEHGDFAPWNIINTSKGTVPFDFEYFVEDGLEYFDLIKYHYQIGKLLKGMRPDTLANYVIEKILVDEANILLKLFLAKEILVKMEECEDYGFEQKMLDFLEK
ncbi:hypothetical protein [Hydrogenimonas urashimensis]|uniref:hypothetical protein n=1 Tax=Hydrogenimonas urashimensis TaxID=2740515 RepID=UPI0019157DC6|nr:hypothetical protein [Hydrogenimonas urashimensis]